MLKFCNTCKQEKPLAEFFRRTASPDGFTAACKGCTLARSKNWRRVNATRDAENKKRYATKFPEVARGARARYRESNPEAYLESQDKYRLAKYGVTPEKFREMSAAQSGVCKICGKPPTGSRGFCVDHCHKTGKVRSLLCGKCNSALGMVNEDTKIIYNMAAYVEGLL